LPPKKKKKNSNNLSKEEKRKLRIKFYNTQKWRDLRKTYMMEHPLCESCLAKGKIVPAEDIHHKKSFIQDGEIKWELGYDYNNLMALCKDCHGQLHQEEKGFVPPEKIIEALEALFEDV
jgi:5-methylcytosine-specific restriction protein A